MVDKGGFGIVDGFEHRLRACTNKALDCGVWWCFHALKRWVSFDSLCTLRFEPLWRMFFARFIGRYKKIHTKLNCVSNESGKRGRIIREVRIPWICSEKGSRRVPVSFIRVEDFLRKERSILVGDKIML